MTKSHITKLGLTVSSIQFRLVSEVVVSKVLGGGKRLSIDLLGKIIHQGYWCSISNLKLIDKLVSEGQQTIEDTMLKSE